jgi:predicted peptidase
VTGTAVHSLRYEYGVDYNADPNNPFRYSLEVKLNVDGSDSSEWTKTYTDASGRVFKTLYAAPSACAWRIRKMNGRNAYPAALAAL